MSMLRKEFVAAAGLLILAMALIPTPTVADKSYTITGYISDSMCGLDHSDMMAKHGGTAEFDQKACVLACVKGGAKFVLADPEGHKVYNIKHQDKVKDFAGQRVEVVGHIEKD